MPKSDKAKQSAFPLSYSAAGHRIITAEDGSIFELMHHVNETELRDVLAKHPGLLAENIVSAVESGSDKPYKIKFGEGYFANARLARKMNPDDNTYEYLIERKILPTETLTKKNSGREFSERKTVLKTSQSELRASMRLSFFKSMITPTTSKLEKNTRGEDQLYQFLPISELGDLSKIFDIMFISNSFAIEETQRKKLYLAAIAKYMIRAVMELHNKNYYHRDIKPENFLLNNDGIPLLADFGTLAYKTNENTIETVSDITSKLYAPFNFLRQIFSDREQNLRMHDQWSLALSILKIYGINVVREYTLHHANTIHPGDPLFESKYKKFMRHFSASLASNDALKKMPEYLRQFILTALNPDQNNPKQITEAITLPEENEDEKNMLRSVYDSVCIYAASENERFFNPEYPVNFQPTNNTDSDAYYLGYDDDLNTPVAKPATDDNNGYVAYSVANGVTHSPRLFQGVKPPSSELEPRPAGAHHKNR